MLQTEPLTDWIARQQQRAADALFGAISATHLVKQRPGFGQVIIPAPGSVLASPVDASWDPDPDYFFHWLRDGALVMDAVRLLRNCSHLGQLAEWELGQYVGFSCHLASLDGAARLHEAPLERGVAGAFLQYVRDSDEFRRVRGDVARGDVRFNPEGSLDITRWSRPQYDGVALRALGLLRAFGARRSGPDTSQDWAGLIADDLDCVARNASRPCVDLWEEEEGFHFHTMLVQYAALRQGGDWASAMAAGGAAAGLAARARLWRAAADDLWPRLGQLRRVGAGDSDGWIASRMAAADGPAISPDKLLDSSVILGVIHAGLEAGPFSVADPLVHAALLRLEDHFAASFPLNARRAADCAPHLGRNPADSYFDGGAWPLITLAAAELRFRLAIAITDGRALAADIDPRMWFGGQAIADPDLADPAIADLATAADCLVAAGEMGFAAVRAVTPADGSMAEQADRETGAPRSARHLSWSYAAFVSAAEARRQALEPLK